jgi:hypothetical protein
MIEHSDSITKVLAAIHAVQKQVDGVSKDARNPHFKNRYASLESVVDTIRGPYLAAGLVVMQGPGKFVDGTLSVTTMIAHAESGEWIKSTFQIPVQKNDPQGAGSAQTYGQRYSLMALFNLPPVDDDGEAARPQRAPAQDAPAAPKKAADVWWHAKQRILDAIQNTTTAKELADLETEAWFKKDAESLPDDEWDHVKVVTKRHRSTFSTLMAG